MAGRVVAGADGFGAALKDALVAYIRGKGIEVDDLGVDKYYTVATKVASQVAKDPNSANARGLLVCGTGMGVSIFANKLRGVYAAPCNSVAEALNARSINNINVLTLGAKVAPEEEAKRIVDAWLETPFSAPCPASDGAPWSHEIQAFLENSLQEMARVSDAEEDGVSRGTSSSLRKDVGALENPSSPVAVLADLLDTIALAPPSTDTSNAGLRSEARAGVGLGLTTIHAPLTSTRSTADAALAASTDQEEKEEARLGCVICALAKGREFEEVAVMPGGSWTVVREEPTAAMVRFRAGSVEPAHHHTFGHDVMVRSGRKTVWNVTTGERVDLESGDYLYTPAGDVHRVMYHEDTEFFIRWDGRWDILLDEDVAAANAAIALPELPSPLPQQVSLTP